ncbi:MAG: hypothetical protein NC548_10645 [Lachnospiraceae bacterium]|nr:hypothetical protein [Lachnospiraceae bacterium]
MKRLLILMLVVSIIGLVNPEFKLFAAETISSEQDQLASSQRIIPVYQLEKEVVTGMIFVGDSRLNAMQECCDFTSLGNAWVIAKDKAGLSWLTNKGVQLISDIMSENPDIDEWTLVMLLGVNDTYNATKYIKLYQGFDDVQVLCVSVNPVDVDKCDNYGYNGTLINSGIESFNSKLLDSEFVYLDTNSLMKVSGFQTTDGLHYTTETYETLFKLLELELQEYLAEADIDGSEILMI